MAGDRSAVGHSAAGSGTTRLASGIPRWQGDIYEARAGTRRSGILTTRTRLSVIVLRGIPLQRRCSGLHVSAGRIGIVCIGAFNPAILNHDFLDRMNVLPDDDEPVEVDSQRDLPFGEFVATPMASFIKYPRFRVLVVQDRLDISANPEPDESQALETIAGVVTKYVEVLRHTPITKYGVNVSRTFTCEDQSEAAPVMSRLFADTDKMEALVGRGAKPRSATFAGVDGNTRWRVNVVLKDEEPLCIQVNVNHEHDYVDPVELKATLGQLKEITERADSLVERLMM